jgi:hypothetical protein
MRLLVKLVLTTLLFMVWGCGTSPENFAVDSRVSTTNVAGPLFSFLTQGEAVLTGFLVTNAGLSVTSEAPVAGAGVGGAMVRAFDLAGDEVASVATAADGAFRLDDVPPGYLRLEIYLAASAQPDLIVEVTAIPGLVIPVGQQFPVNRDQALQQVLAQVPHGARVVGALQPLPPGTIFGPRRGELREGLPKSLIEEHQWFFFVDFEPGAMYAHEVEFVLVNAESGELQSFSEVEWYPHFNNIPFWSTPSELYFADGRPSPEVSQEPVLSGKVSISERVSPQMIANGEDVFVLIISGDEDDLRFLASRVDLEIAYAEAEMVKVVAFSSLKNFDTARAELESAFEIFQTRIQQKREAGRKPTFILHILSHGVPYKDNIARRTSSFASLAATETKKEPYKILGVIVDGIVIDTKDFALFPCESEVQAIDYIERVGDGEFLSSYFMGILPVEDRYCALGLKELGLGELGACKLRIVLDFCNSGLFARELKDCLFPDDEERPREDVKIIACAFGIGGIDNGGTTFTQKVFLEFASLDQGDLVGLWTPSNKPVVPAVKRPGGDGNLTQTLVTGHRIGCEPTVTIWPETLGVAVEGPILPPANFSLFNEISKPLMISVSASPPFSVVGQSEFTLPDSFIDPTFVQITALPPKFKTGTVTFEIRSMEGDLIEVVTRNVETVEGEYGG